MGTGLQALGEKQVNFSTNGSSGGVVGAQADPAVAALANGDFVVVYENPHSGDSLLAHFFDANGNAIGPPVSSGLLNGVVAIDPVAQVGVQPAIAATPDGGFLVAYTDTSVTYTNPAHVTFAVNDIVVRRYDNTTGISAPVVIDSGAASIHLPNAGPVHDPAIAAFADGTSIVVWEFDYGDQAGEDDVYFGLLNSTATALVGGPRTLDVHNGFQGEARVATSGNLAAMVYAYDQGPLYGQDIMLDLVNSSGTAPAAPTHIFGATTLDTFSDPDVAALSDGRFVVVARDDTTSALVASIFDPVTLAVTPVNLASLPFGPGGTDPQVAGVPGGGFVLSLDNSAGGLTQARFGPGGSVQLYAIAGSSTTRTQDQSAAAANASGTAFFAWQDASSSNPNSTDPDTRVEAQAFEVPRLPQPDFNGDLHPDILLQSTSGQAAVWELNVTSVIGGGPVAPNPGPAWKAIGTGDFNGDGLADIVWQNTSTGQASVWEMNGNTLKGGGSVTPNPGPSWKAIGTGDFNDDGHSDILWQNATTGQASIWEMNGTSLTGGGPVTPNPGPSWKAIGTGDFNGDGFSDILWQNANGQAAIWEMKGNALIGGGPAGPNPGPSWKVIGAGDFNGDGKSDILWQNANGQAAIWEMDGSNQIGGGLVGANPGPSWELIGAGNFKGDDFSDLLWRNTSGQAAIWEMHETNVIGGGLVGANPGPSWRAV